MMLAAAVVVALAVLGAAWRVAGELRTWREDAARTRALQLLAVFATGVAGAAEDPRALLTWQHLSTTARQLCPDEFAALDRAAGGSFPFSSEHVRAAHARWTTDWLTWEAAHDAEYKLKTATAQADLRGTEHGSEGSGAVARAQLAAIEQEKLDRYQRRYEEYTRVSRALQAVLGPGTPPGNRG